MKDMKIYTVKDAKAALFGNLFLCVNDAVAQRQFQEQFKDSYIKEDLQLYCLGEYDTETGEISYNQKFIANYILEVNK